MEIPEDIVRDIFKETRNSSTYKELDELLDEMLSYDLNDILFKQEESRLYDISLQIHRKVNFVLNKIYYSNSIDNISTQNEIIQIFKTLIVRLNSGISENNIKQLLAFLSINCYTKIDISYFKEFIEISDNDSISEEITKLIKSVKINIHLKNDAPFREKKLRSVFNKGLEEENLNKLYGFISAMERGGMGYFNYLLQGLMELLFYLNYESFIGLLNGLNHPEYNVFYLTSLKIESLYSTIKNKQINNKWTLFELIRRMISFENNENKSNEKLIIDACINGLEKLHKNDKEIYFQTITFFHSSLYFNSALGHQLKNVGRRDLKRIFIESLPIDKYSFHGDSRTKLLEVVNSNVKQENLNFILKVVYGKWRDFYNTIVDSKESYQNSLLLTDYCDFIVCYYAILEKENLEIKITGILKSLIWINSEWFRTESHKLTMFHLYLTELYLLSYAIRENSLINKTVINLFQQFELNEDYQGNINASVNKNILKIIEENLKWDYEKA